MSRARRKASKKGNGCSGYGFGMVVLVGVVLALIRAHPILSAIIGTTLLGLFVLSMLVKKENEKGEIERIKESGIAEIDLMSGIDFEVYLSHLFEGLGYSVELTPASGDYGADLILFGNKKKTVVQAKCYSRPVSNKAVQEIYSAKDYYDADEAWVVTNARYTTHAVSTANKLSVVLIGREELINLLTKWRNQ